MCRIRCVNQLIPPTTYAGIPVWTLFRPSLTARCRSFTMSWSGGGTAEVAFQHLAKDRFIQIIVWLPSSGAFSSSLVRPQSVAAT